MLQLPPSPGLSRYNVRLVLPLYGLTTPFNGGSLVLLVPMCVGADSILPPEVRYDVVDILVVVPDVGRMTYDYDSTMIVHT